MSANWNHDRWMADLEAIAALIASPFVQFAAETFDQPPTQLMIREGMVASERIKETVAQIQEVLEDLAHQAEAKLAAERQLGSTVEDHWIEFIQTEEPDLKTSIRQISMILNQQTKRLSYGVVDLQILMSMAMAALAVRQLIVKGIDLDEIPWYTLVWYAFDNFVKSTRGDTHDAHVLEEISQQLMELSQHGV